MLDTRLQYQFIRCFKTDDIDDETQFPGVGAQDWLCMESTESASIVLACEDDHITMECGIDISCCRAAYCIKRSINSMSFVNARDCTCRAHVTRNFDV
mmetsp:Transcript_64940/g.89187  ORF Transcript_64940/g.89187 Transcript_64940/m.89187 type:complete len:98 (-) Transcript_64940:1134-1427(-)